MKLKKSISFNSIVYVYLIPHRNEYNDIKNMLWWNSLDYMNFRYDYIQDCQYDLQKEIDEYKLS